MARPKRAQFRVLRGTPQEEYADAPVARPGFHSRDLTYEEALRRGLLERETTGSGREGPAEPVPATFEESLRLRLFRAQKKALLARSPVSVTPGSGAGSLLGASIYSRTWTRGKGEKQHTSSFSIPAGLPIILLAMWEADRAAAYIASGLANLNPFAKGSDVQANQTDWVTWSGNLILGKVPILGPIWNAVTTQANQQQVPSSLQGSNPALQPTGPVVTPGNTPIPSGSGVPGKGYCWPGYALMTLVTPNGPAGAPSGGYLCVAAQYQANYLANGWAYVTA